MKSPPLLVAALLACIIVLGFNYWVASSRNADLQAALMNNITTNERLIQSLKEHLKELQTEYGKLQIDVYQFQKNQTNLQRKFSYDLSQCINQMKELKEHCEERINEITKKGSDVSQVRENKDFPEDSKKSGQADSQLPALKQSEFMQTDSEQPKDDDVPKEELTVKKTDTLQAQERISGLAAIGKQDPKAEEEKLSGELKHPQDSVKAPAEKDLHPAEDEKHVTGQDALMPAAEQDATEEVEREQLLNFDDKQSAPPPGKADNQAQDALKDKDVDYNVDENEAESETDKQAALAGIANVQNSDENMKNHLYDQTEKRERL
ncbi:Golgi membrane protein 1 isoform 2-T3 [Mergus octosetaceus]